LGKSSNEENNTSSSEDSNSADENRPVLKQEQNVLPIRPASQAFRPSTPAHSLGQKRSLTILSPQGISTRTTRELKKSRSAAALSTATSTTIFTPTMAQQPNSQQQHQNTARDSDTGDTTDNDLELGFQFLN